MAMSSSECWQAIPSENYTSFILTSVLLTTFKPFVVQFAPASADSGIADKSREKGTPGTLKHQLRRSDPKRDHLIFKRICIRLECDRKMFNRTKSTRPSNESSVKHELAFHYRRSWDHSNTWFAEYEGRCEMLLLISLKLSFIWFSMPQSRFSKHKNSHLPPTSKHLLLHSDLPWDVMWKVSLKSWNYDQTIVELDSLMQKGLCAPTSALTSGFAIQKHSHLIIELKHFYQFNHETDHINFVIWFTLLISLII
jgi:hypothetical protein